MKKILRLGLLLLLALWNNRFVAQVVFYPHHIQGVNNSVPEGTLVSDSVNFKNNSTTLTFHDTVTFITAIKDSATHAYIPTKDSIHSGLIYLAPGGSNFAPLHRTYNTSSTSPTGPYKTGINVIVIWPSCTNTSGMTFRDTLFDTVYVSKVIGIAPLNIYNLFSMYPNPSTGELTLERNLPAEKEVEVVTIYTDRGQPCARFEKRYQLDLSSLPKGYYMVEVLFRDGSRGRRKLILE